MVGFKLWAHLRGIAMFEIKDVYNIFKPIDNPMLITPYDVVFSGIQYAPSYQKGVILLSLISSEVLSSQNRTFNSDSEGLSVKQESSILHNFQCDVYKENDVNVKEIQSYSEAIKLREWLKSLYTFEFLKGKKAEIYANYATIIQTSEMLDNVLINRAMFEFSIVAKYAIIENEKDYITKISFNNDVF